MSTSVRVSTHTHTFTYVTEKILLSLKEIVREIGLSPQQMVREWPVLEAGIKTWLETGDLRSVMLEVSDPSGSRLMGRWDFEIVYSYQGDGGFWVDTVGIRYHIQKSGHVASRCKYRVVVDLGDGHPPVPGWGTTSLLSTEGFSRFGIGATIDGRGIGTRTHYWSR